jgi:hypothetical protein
MSAMEKARGRVGGAFADRLGGEKPRALRAAAGAAMAGGVTTVVVYRLLRQDAGDE